MTPVPSSPANQEHTLAIVAKVIIGALGFISLLHPGFSVSHGTQQWVPAASALGVAVVSAAYSLASPGLKRDLANAASLGQQELSANPTLAAQLRAAAAELEAKGAT